MAFPVGAAIIGASTIGASLIPSIFGSSAGDAQKEAATLAAELQLNMFNKSRQDLRPYRAAASYAYRALAGGMEGEKPEKQDFDYGPPGRRRFNQAAYNQAVADWEATYTPGILTEGPGEFEADPGYQFRLEEGIKAMERGAAARGGQLSGAQMKGLNRFGQDYASNEYQNFLNRWYRSMDPYFELMGLGAGPGQTSAEQSMGAGRSLGQTALYGGQAQAANYLTQGQLFGNALSNMAQNLMAQQLLQPSTTSNALTQLTPGQVGLQTGAPAQIPYNILA